MYISAGETHKTLTVENNMMFKLSLKDGSKVDMELSAEQVGFITSNMILGKTTPLFATTKAKMKYGDCVIGEIISIKEI